jgi:hypothetical protein
MVAHEKLLAVSGCSKRPGFPVLFILPDGYPLIFHITAIRG